MRETKICLIKPIQQESQNIQRDHSDKMLTSSNCDIKSVFKTGFNNCTHTEMMSTTDNECPCENMVLQDLPISIEVKNTHGERESSTAGNEHANTFVCSNHSDNCTENENKERPMSSVVNKEANYTTENDNSNFENGSKLKSKTTQYKRDQLDEEQTTLKSIAGDVHLCSNNDENTLDTQEVTHPMELGISSRQNSDANENTAQLNCSTLSNTFNSRDELSLPLVLEEDHGLLHGNLNDEMQFYPSSYDISKCSSSFSRFDGKTSLNDYTGDNSFGDFLANSDLNNIEVYGCSFSTQRDVTSVKDVARRIGRPLLDIHSGKNKIINEKYQLKKPPLALYSLIKEKVEKYFNLRLRRRASQKKRRVMRRIKKLCLQWRKSEKFNRREKITCHPFLDPGNTEDSTPPQAIAPQAIAPPHPTDEESLQSHTPPESVGSLSSLFNDISFQSVHDDEIYRFEWFRLASFRHFDSESVYAIILARNGWYGTENGNETICYSCHRVRESWESGDDPRAFHDSNCRFHHDGFNNVQIPRDYPQNMIHTDHSRPTTSRNTFHGDRQQLTVPEDSVSTDEREVLSTLSNELSSFSSNSTSVYHVQYGRQDGSERRRDNNQRTEMIENTSPSERGYQSDVSTATQPVTTRNGTAHFPLEAPSEGESQRQTQVQTSEASASSSNREAQLEALRRDPMGINFERPKYPSYAILAVRISSYTDWPAAMTQTPRDMALAGFFYAGCGDYTRCFFCGGGLRNWEAGDDPWVEHARWFSKCAFVRQNRGQQFIDLVLHRMREIEQQQTEPQVTDPTDDKASKEERIMKSAAVKSIQDMGYSEEIIKTAISTIKSRLPKGKHKVSAHEILEVVFELVDRERARSSSESSLKRRSEGESVTESLFNNTNVSRESHEISPPQQGGVGENETASRRTDSLTLNEVESLQRENTSLKDQILCKVCMEKNVSIAFLPCGHLACCVDCAPAMRKCPICREFVRGTVKTFLV